MDEFRLDDFISIVLDEDPDADPLQQLNNAVLLAEHLGDITQRLVEHFVEGARNSGVPWNEIGTALGVSQQAVRQRFPRREPPPPPPPPRAAADPQLFGKFTDRAQAVIVAAQREARQAGNDRVNGEHLALGLLSDPKGLAAKAMVEGSGMPINLIRDAITAALPPRARKMPKQLMLGLDSRKILDSTLRATLRLGQNFVGVEHILLGILNEYDTPAARTLMTLGISPEWTEEWIVNELSGPLRKGPR
jgi:hypothetical protein